MDSVADFAAPASSASSAGVNFRSRFTSGSSGIFPLFQSLLAGDEDFARRQPAEHPRCGPSVGQGSSSRVGIAKVDITQP